jgi:hypothetical protein
LALLLHQIDDLVSSLEMKSELSLCQDPNKMQVNKPFSAIAYGG